MEVVTIPGVLVFLTFFASCLTVAATAAVEVGACAGSIIAAAGTGMKSALLYAAFAACAGLLLVSAGPATAVLAAAVPLQGWPTEAPTLLMALLAIQFGTAVTMIGAAWLGVPTPVLPTLGCAAGAVTAAAGPHPDLLALAVPTGGGIVLALIGCGAAFLVLIPAKRVIAAAPRPRDQLTLTLPLTAALIAVIGVGALMAALDRGTVGAVQTGLSGVLAAGLVGAGAALLAFLPLRRDPFAVSNDLAGVEQAFRRVQVAGATALAVSLAAAPSIAAALPAAMAIGVLRSRAIPAWTELALGANTESVMLVLLGTLLGTVFAGHRVAGWMGTRLLPTGPIAGVGAVFGGGVGTLAAGMFGLPASGAAIGAGGLIGAGIAAGQIGPMTGPLQRLGVSWLLAPAVAAILALVVFTLCRIILG